MLDTAIKATQSLCLLAVIVSGLVFLLTGQEPTQFATLMWVIIGALIVYLPLEGISRVI